MTHGCRNDGVLLSDGKHYNALLENTSVTDGREAFSMKLGHKAFCAGQIVSYMSV